MIKKIIGLIFILCILSASSVNIYADSVYAEKKVYTSNTGNVKATGYIPSVKNLTNPIFENKVNTNIKNIYADKINEASSKKVKALHFNCDIVSDGSILSIVIYITNTSNSTSEVCSVVINRKVNEYVSIPNIIGINGYEYASKVVENKIKNDKTIKYSSTPTVDESTPFYIRYSNVVVLYGAGQIAPISKGVRSFDIPSSGLSNYVITKDYYYKKSSYNVSMIPLRSVLSAFGYSMLWNASSNSVTITSGDFKAKLTIGRNSYIKGNNYPTRLEFAPEIHNSSTYVPISFFSEILGMLFKTDSSGNIVISKYTL